jgi:hypothetical protein
MNQQAMVGLLCVQALTTSFINFYTICQKIETLFVNAMGIIKNTHFLHVCSSRQAPKLLTFITVTASHLSSV